ncbi:MAG: glycosyltransferase family 4 protein [Gaiellaceae bacterium]
MKLLLVTMYWPPAGGAGVQRPLKLSGQLARLGFEVHVLAPEGTKWVQRDNTLREPEGVAVHRIRNIGPAARRPGEELHGLRGIARFRRQAPLTLRALLAPDASVLWNATAIPAARRIAKREEIDVVLTTSPPGSVHLVGLAVQRLGVPWVADLRDSIASHAHRRRDIRGERALARLVARRADAIVAASSAIDSETQALGPRGPVAAIPNGCDFDDFDGLAYRAAPRFRITHTGGFTGRRSPRPFLEALARSEADVTARFVGDFRAADREWAEGLGLGDRLELVPYLPHREALALQRDSEALLLIVPEAGGRGRGVLSAKVFEYLAAERPILAVVPPDGEAARLLGETGAAVVVAPDDVDGMARAIADLEGRWRAGKLDGATLSAEARQRLSRTARAEELAEVLRRVV